MNGKIWKEKKLGEMCLNWKKEIHRMRTEEERRRRRKKK